VMAGLLPVTVLHSLFVDYRVSSLNGVVKE
jgi:hypothetical protein